MLRIIWNGFKMFLHTFAFILIPIPIAFNLYLPDIISRNESFHSLLISFVPLFYFLDIVYKLNSAFFEKGSLITKRKKIIKMYAQSELFFDLLIIFFSVIYLINKSSNMWPLLLLVYGKFFETKRILREIEDNFHFSNETEGIFRLLKLAFKVIFIAHLCGCIWHFITLDIENESETWLSKIPTIHRNNNLQRYIYSLYWAVTTIVTVGYGDIVPTNLTELIISIFVIIVGCGVFAYSVNSFGMIITDMERDKNEFQ